jgi:signal peptidase I
MPFTAPFRSRAKKMAKESEKTTAEPTALESGKETVRTLISALLIALVIRTFAFEPFNIPSSSMVPSLLVGDFLFVSKFSYGYGSQGTFWGFIPYSGRLGGSDPKRGDIVVFKLPRDPSIDYIKRLIGLPGDTVQMRQGILYINGVPVERDRLENPLPLPDGHAPAEATDYLEHLPQGPTHVIRKLGEDKPLDDTEVFSVPAHHYFFMGDNRDNSSDSRDPRSGVGFVPEENLVGKADFLFFSIEEHTHFWEFWTWPWTVRWSRILMQIQ